MKLKLDDKSYIEIKEDKLKNKARISIKTKSDKKSIIVTAELEEEQVVKLIAELISIKAGLYGRA
jgi:hypothetical protein